MEPTGYNKFEQNFKSFHNSGNKIFQYSVEKFLYENGVDYIESSKIAMQSFYTVWNNEELKKYLQEVLIENNDYKKPERISVIESLRLDSSCATDKIISELKKDLEINIK